MNKIAGLPKSAHLIADNSYLIIKNHKPEYGFSILRWILNAIYSDVWDEALSQMISQGFQFTAVMEHCTYELKHDDWIFAHLITEHYKITTDSLSAFVYSLNSTGREMALLFIKKIDTCVGWLELYNEMKLDSVFTKGVIKRFESEMKS